MRLIVSPAPPSGRSFFVRASSHPSPGKKPSRFSKLFFSLSPCLHSQRSSVKINIRRYRKNRLCSRNGGANPFRSVIRPVDSGRLGPAGGLGAMSRPAPGLRVLRSSWTLGGRSCSSGLAVRLLSVSAAKN